MKMKLLMWSLLSLMAAAMTGCSSSDDEVVPPQPQPEPEVVVPVISLKEAELKCDAAGGVFKLAYSVVPVTDETSVSVDTESAWVRITGMEEDGVDDKLDGFAEFEVEANTSADAREAEIVLSYKDAQKVTFAVKQAGKEGQEPEQELTLDITATAGDELGENKTTMITFTVKSPLAARFDFSCIRSSDVDVMLQEGKTLEAILDVYAIALDAEYVEQIRSDAGFPLQMGPLASGTEYSLVAKVTGYDETTLLKRCDGKTDRDTGSGENLDAPFTAEISQEVVPGGFAMVLRPDELSMQYVCHFVLKGTVEHLGRDENIINSYLQMGDAIYNYVFTGPVETTAEQFVGENALIPGAEYYIIAFGFDGYNATTPLYKKLVKAGAGPSDEGMTMDIKVFDITPFEVSVTITTNKDLVPYVFEIVSKSWYDLTLPEFANEYELLREYAAANLFEFNQVNFGATPANVIESFGAWYSGVTTTFYDLEPGMEAMIFAMTCDAEGNLGKIYKLSEPFTTLSEDASTASVRAEEVVRPMIYRPMKNYSVLMHK